VLFEYTRVLPNVRLEEMIVFKDYSVNRAGEMRHVSEYVEGEWSNARDRRTKRRPAVEQEPVAANAA
jgi:mannose-1-phosphate guanylyltransferase